MTTDRWAKRCSSCGVAAGLAHTPLCMYRPGAGNVPDPQLESCEVCGVLLGTVPDQEALRYAVQGGAFVAGAEWSKPENQRRLASGERPIIALVHCCGPACAAAAYDAVVWRVVWRRRSGR